MKVILTLSLIFVIISCTIKDDKDIQGPVVMSNDGAVEPIDRPYQCYIYAKNKDTIRLQIREIDKKIQGWMVYDFYEKDGSFGEVDGEQIGDTLKLTYEFLAEGMISKMEKHFLKDKTVLSLGAGNVFMSEDSIFRYTNPSELNFKDETALVAMKSCPENFISEDAKSFFVKYKAEN